MLTRMSVSRGRGLIGECRLVLGSALGLPAVRRRAVCVPVLGRHRWQAGQAHQQQLSTGGAV